MLTSWHHTTTLRKSFDQLDSLNVFLRFDSVITIDLAGVLSRRGDKKLHNHWLDYVLEHIQNLVPFCSKQWIYQSKVPNITFLLLSCSFQVENKMRIWQNRMGQKGGDMVTMLEIVSQT